MITGDSPLIVAARSRHIPMFDHGLDVNHSRPVTGNDSSMNSYLEWVETSNNLSAEASFSFNTRYENGGESLLHYAVKNRPLTIPTLKGLMKSRNCFYSLRRHQSLPKRIEF